VLLFIVYNYAFYYVLFVSLSVVIAVCFWVLLCCYGYCLWLWFMVVIYY